MKRNGFTCWFVVSAAFVLSASCVSPEQRVEDAEQRAKQEATWRSMEEQASRPVICDSGDECSAMWGRVTSQFSIWCGYRIQTSSDYLIETYGPIQSVRTIDKVACRSVRNPIDARRSEIQITTSCWADCNMARIAKFQIVGDLLSFKDSMHQPEAPRSPDPTK